MPHKWKSRSAGAISPKWSSAQPYAGSTSRPSESTQRSLPMSSRASGWAAMMRLRRSRCHAAAEKRGSSEDVSASGCAASS